MFFCDLGVWNFASDVLIVTLNAHHQNPGQCRFFAFPRDPIDNGAAGQGGEKDEQGEESV